jgi:hypothetical protein
MSAHLPPGWPAAVRPPGTPGWEGSALQWLLDLCPPDYRGYGVLQRHPLALAWLAGQHVAGSRQACARALATARDQLADDLGPGALQQVLQTIEQEQARLIAAARAIGLIEQALRGHRYVPRL